MRYSNSKLIQIFLIASLFFAHPAFANVVGAVIFKTGDVSITHADSTVAQAEKNTALNTGDTLETREGRVQFSLIDGGKVSLQPNSIFKINKYEFSGKEDGSEFAFMELVKGGLRTITGLIGHKNRERYQLKTAVATIGIRGTEFTVNFNNNQFLMTTNYGSVDVCNGGDCLNAATGQSIAVSGPSGKPQYSKKAAKAAAPHAPSDPTFAVTDPVNNAGIPNVIAANGGTGTTETVISLATMQNGVDNNGVYVGTTTYTGNAGNGPNPSAGNSPNGNALKSYTDNSGSPIIVTGTILEANSNGIVKWGRASGGTYNNQPMLMSTWITGTAAPSTALVGLVGTYNVSASTAPYMVNNNVITAVGTPNSVTGYLNIDFSQYSFIYGLTVPIAGATHSVASSGSLTAGSAKFRDIVSSMGVLYGGSIVEGALYGANAQIAALQYGFHVSGSGVRGGGGNVYGNVVLQQVPLCNC